MKLLTLIVFSSLFYSITCSEPMLDFLNIQKTHPEIDFKLTKECENSFDLIKKGIDENEIWAIKVLDASGRTQPGFVWGNSFWLGSKRACEMLNNPKRIPLPLSSSRLMLPHIPEIATKVPVEYRMFHASHTSPIQFDSDTFEFVGLHIGLCFPKACHEEEIKRMAEVVFQSGEFKNTAIFGDVKFNMTRTLKLRENFFEETAVRLLM